MMLLLDFAVQVHCKYFQWLTSAQNTKRVASLGKCLGEQGGSHTQYINLFIEGEKKFKDAFMHSSDRVDYARALNYARLNRPKPNDIPITGPNAFTEYWEYILPDSGFKLGF